MHSGSLTAVMNWKHMLARSMMHCQHAAAIVALGVAYLLTLRTDAWGQ